MFSKSSIKVNEIVPTSKMSLKLSCLSACGNDIEKAEKLYKFLASDLSELPESDPVRLTGMQQFRKGADEIIEWIGNHQEDISRGISMINGLKSRTVQTSVISADIAPIPKP